MPVGVEGLSGWKENGGHTSKQVNRKVLLIWKALLFSDTVCVLVIFRVVLHMVHPFAALLVRRHYDGLLLPIYRFG